MTVFGQDASDFDWSRGPMDLVAARGAGIDFFTHKATEGTRTKHTKFGEAMRRARDAGIPVLGAYGIPRTPGGSQGSDRAQVDYFLSYVDAAVPWWRSWPHWMFQVDLEHWEYDKVAPAHGLAWCQMLAEQAGRRVVLYAPQWAYGNTVGGSWPLWASAYGANPAGPFRALYPGDGSSRWKAYSGREPTILQYGSKTVIGRQSVCDANAFRGDLAALLAFVGGTSSPAPSTSGGVDNMGVAEDAFGRSYNGGQGAAVRSDSWMALAVERPLNLLLAGQAASAQREQDLAAALAALGEALKAGGGSIDVASIRARIDERSADVTGRIAALEAELDEARRRLADALAGG